MSSDLLQEPKFVQERPAYVAITAPWSPGMVQAADVILGRYSYYARHLTLTLFLGFPEPDHREAEQ